VYWGDLDFLLADLPPGTGDVSISMASFLPGARMLVVTTPQEAARKVAERAGKMAEQPHLTVLGVIENMSYYICPHCGERENIFGQGGGQEAANTLGVPLFGQIPLVPALRVGGDDGTPIVVSDPRLAGRRRTPSGGPAPGQGDPNPHPQAAVTRCGAEARRGERQR